ncbi:preprotein translocase subunit SecE [Wenzhouxiangella sp. AB-CW3]|uniref:preprotein translocase subunit SecE n=1 Tax=Wenzhouxiangella sp. AB-CW3 TaxID=2771012 RepID=UPI00168BF0CC|nr:preprotein translocase subunit SecE [Wenzhouxiangella sp. AB-CW3]QOC23362.1 preprotein translocase subunit SecE [Wenzhouxiangella sp. AB-CW3]
MAAEKTSPRDNLLWAAGLLVLAAGLYGFIHFAGEVMLLFRVLGLLAAVGVALAIVGQTARGRGMFGFLRETDVERRKVVWPTRDETLQTTLMVLVITIIVAIMLFLMDTLFGWIVRRLIGAGGGA